MDPLNSFLGEENFRVIDIAFLHDGILHQVIATKLQFAHGILYILVNEADDTIHVTTDAPPVEPSKKWNFDSTRWSIINGKRIQWYWWLTNNQGYRDGLQFEFMTESRDEPPMAIQFIAIGSCLSVREVRFAD